MSIPIKSSRPIKVDAVSYRWMVRQGRARRAQSKVSGCRILTVQKLGTTKPDGQILQAVLYSKTWVGLDQEEERSDDVTISPEVVGQVIRLSLEQGWSPESKRGIFKEARIDLEDWETTEEHKS